MNERDLDVLVESAVTVHRLQDREGRILAPSGWWDLPIELCDEVYRRQLLSREMERLLDTSGMSGTVQAVLARITGSR
jgi:hypothetical protein